MSARMAFARPPHRDPQACRRRRVTRFTRLVGSALVVGMITLSAPDPVAAQSSDARVVLQAYDAFVAEAAQRFDVPPDWIRAVLWQESRGKPLAVSPMGARGLMQIMPATWDGLRTRHGFGEAPFDPRDNILAGTAYLRKMHDRYRDVSAMLAAYNAGPGRVDEWLRDGRPLPRETRAYIAAILPQIGGVTASEPQSDDPFAAPIFVLRSRDDDGSGTAALPSTRTPTGSTQSSQVHTTTSAPATPIPAPNAVDSFLPSVFVDRSTRETSP